jgi:acylphosphatase
VRRTATKRGVNGWAENLPDGSVEAVLEGEREAVQAVAACCRHTPVDERQEPAQGVQGFGIP